MNDDCYDPSVTDCLGVGISCFDDIWYPEVDGECEMGLDESAHVETKTIHVPKKEDGIRYEPRRNSMIGPSTVNNDMVFIPTMTGEVYVHSVTDGAYIDVFYCPEYEFREEDGSTTPNREGTRSGQTMFEDYMIFYCGANYVHPTDHGSDATLQQGFMVVMQLKSDDESG